MSDFNQWADWLENWGVPYSHYFIEQSSEYWIEFCGTRAIFDTEGMFMDCETMQ